MMPSAALCEGCGEPFMVGCVRGYPELCGRCRASERGPDDVDRRLYAVWVQALGAARADEMWREKFGEAARPATQPKAFAVVKCTDGHAHGFAEYADGVDWKRSVCGQEVERAGGESDLICPPCAEFIRRAAADGRKGSDSCVVETA